MPSMLVFCDKDVSYIYALDSGDRIKIGKANNPAERAKQHQYATGVYMETVGLWSVAKSSALKVEKLVHRGLRSAGIQGDGEWYEGPKDTIISVVGSIVRGWVADQKLNIVATFKKYNALRRSAYLSQSHLENLQDLLSVVAHRLDAQRNAKQKAEESLQDMRVEMENFFGDMFRSISREFDGGLWSSAPREEISALEGTYFYTMDKHYGSGIYECCAAGLPGVSGVGLSAEEARDNLKRTLLLWKEKLNIIVALDPE